MVQISIGQGQGITQAIKAQIQANGGQITNNSLSVWQQVMTEVKTANNNRGEGKDPFYTGGDDVSKIGDRSSWGKDFKTTLGQVIELAQDVWNKIVELLTGKAPESSEPEQPAEPTPAAVPENSVEPESAPETNNDPEVLADEQNNEQDVEQPPQDNRAQANQDYARAMSNPDNWQAVTSEPPIEIPPEMIIDSPPQYFNPSETPEPVEPPAADNSERKGMIEQKSDDGQIVRGNYKISAADSGKGFNLQIDNMNIFYMSKNNIDVFSNANIRKSDYGSLICHNAVYNDIIAKQSDGVELTEAEQKYIEAYMTAIDKCNLSLDENGSYILKGEPVKKTVEFPNAVKPQYDGDDEYASCKNLKKVLESYGFKVGKEYDTGGGDMGRTVYPITSKDGNIIEFPKYCTRREMSEFIRKMTFVPPQHFKF